MADAQKIDRNLIDRILNPIFILYSRKKKKKKKESGGESDKRWILTIAIFSSDF